MIMNDKNGGDLKISHGTKNRFKDLVWTELSISVRTYQNLDHFWRPNFYFFQKTDSYRSKIQAKYTDV